MSITRKIAAFVILLLVVVPSVSVFGQEICDPDYTRLDYRYYTLDAGLAGDYEMSYALFGCWAEAFPEDAGVAYMDRAAIRLMEGDYEGAMADLDLAESGGNSGIIPLRRAFVYLAMGDYQPIIDTIPTFRDEFPLRLPETAIVLNLAYRLRGIARVDAGEYAVGLDDLMNSFRGTNEADLTSEDAPAVLAIARALQMTGELENAAQAYSTYVTLAGDAVDPEIVALVQRIAEIGIEAFSDETSDPDDPTGGWFD